eukprot:29980-Pelagococcus_subviridis.AAC.4
MRVRGRRASSGGDLWRQSGFFRGVQTPRVARRCHRGSRGANLASAILRSRSRVKLTGCPKLHRARFIDSTTNSNECRARQGTFHLASSRASHPSVRHFFSAPPPPPPPPPLARALSTFTAASTSRFVGALPARSESPPKRSTIAISFVAAEISLYFSNARANAAASTPALAASFTSNALATAATSPFPPLEDDDDDDAFDDDMSSTNALGAKSASRSRPRPSANPPPPPAASPRFFVGETIDAEDRMPCIASASDSNASRSCVNPTTPKIVNFRTPPSTRVSGASADADAARSAARASAPAAAGGSDVEANRRIPSRYTTTPEMVSDAVVGGDGGSQSAAADDDVMSSSTRRATMAFSVAVADAASDSNGAHFLLPSAVVSRATTTPPSSPVNAATAADAADRSHATHRSFRCAASVASCIACISLRPRVDTTGSRVNRANASTPRRVASLAARTISIADASSSRRAPGNPTRRFESFESFEFPAPPPTNVPTSLANAVNSRSASAAIAERSIAGPSAACAARASLDDSSTRRAPAVSDARRSASAASTNPRARSASDAAAKRARVRATTRTSDAT